MVGKYECTSIEHGKSGKIFGHQILYTGVATEQEQMKMKL